MGTALRTRSERPTPVLESGPEPTRPRLDLAGLRRVLRRPRLRFPLLAVGLLLVYLLGVRPLLMPGGTTVTVELAVVMILLLVAVLAAAAALVTAVTAGAAAAIPRTRPAWRRWGRRSATASLTAVALVLAVVVAGFGTKWLAYTPPIRDAAPGSIASLEKVNLLGTEQWITVRGGSVENPVLLFLAGGPGGTELAMTRGWADNLEDHFVVVNWDQPGAGKSWNAVPIETLTPERYVEFANELVIQLRERFDEQKIYLMGESWGAALGVMLVQRYPERFHAYIGTAQMVAFLENDTLEYRADLEWARDHGDTALVEKLEAIGPPPWSEDLASKFMTLATSEFGRTEAHTTSDYELFSATARAPEYGIVEKVRAYFSGMEVFDTVYPQLYDIDFRTQAAELDVPVYLLHGRHDINAMPSLVEEYLEVLDAPHKELIWFERSGHNVIPEEPEKLERVLLQILDATYPEA